VNELLQIAALAEGEQQPMPDLPFIPAQQNASDLTGRLERLCVGNHSRMNVDRPYPALL
jgi:hypothetical protein